MKIQGDRGMSLFVRRSWERCHLTTHGTERSPVTQKTLGTQKETLRRGGQDLELEVRWDKSRICTSRRDLYLIPKKSNVL